MSHEATRLAWLCTEPQHGARLVLLALADHHNGITNLCCPSVARLVERTRLERKAVLRAITDLEHLKIISTKRKNGCGSRYTLHFLDQSQNGTGDKMGPVTKEDSTSPKMGRDRSQNGTRNQEVIGNQSGTNPSEAALANAKQDSAVNTLSAHQNVVVVPPELRNALPKETYKDRDRWNEDLKQVRSKIATLTEQPFHHRKPDHKEKLAELKRQETEITQRLDGGKR
jgi:hypothetical protein